MAVAVALGPPGTPPGPAIWVRLGGVPFSSGSRPTLETRKLPRPLLLPPSPFLLPGPPPPTPPACSALPCVSWVSGSPHKMGIMTPVMSGPQGEQCGPQYCAAVGEDSGPPSPSSLSPGWVG